MGVALVTQRVVNTYQEDQGNAVLAAEGTLNRSNKTECSSYKGRWANAQQHI